MPNASLAASLRAEAERANERRLLVLVGDAAATRDAAVDAIHAADIPVPECTAVSASEDWPFEFVEPKKTRELLGRTQSAIVLDGHAECSPNAIGRTVGAVDGGGLYIMLAPALDDWDAQRDAFDETLAVPPFAVEDVTGTFRQRLVETVRAHPGVAICEVESADGEGEKAGEGNGERAGEGNGERAGEGGEEWKGKRRREGKEEKAGEGDGERTGKGREEWKGETENGEYADITVIDDGLTDPWPARPKEHLEKPVDSAFSEDVYTACRTGDQAEAVHALEALRGDEAGNDTNPAIVVEADRGRGKSSAAGLAAGALAREGKDVLVTAPERRSAGELFERARERLVAADALESAEDGTLVADSGGRVRFARPPEAVDVSDDPDAIIVDEAAALPVSLLEGFLSGPPVAFCTTVHGYEGAGRSFDVRFRKRLEAFERPVMDVRLNDPIRYAAGDPVESWAFRALLLDARPPVDQLIEDATPGSVEYRELTTEELLADEHLLRETFGLLVLAHYRTEPNDLARLLDAPNLTCRALLHEGRVVSVALLAREGGLDAATRERVYHGERIRGNMLPDVFTSQLRDESGGEPVGYRVMRIATHHAVRSSGLGSHLLGKVAAEFSVDEGCPADLRGEGVDYLGVGYGATPELLRFWRENGYRTVHLSVTRNDTSGEYSALMVNPLTDAGEALCARHSRWVRKRIPGVLASALTDLDPDIARGAVRTIDDDAVPENPPLSDRDWRVVVDAANGMGSYLAAPEAFSALTVRELVLGEAGLSPDAERLLVEKVLQARSWEAVAADLDRVSTRMTMRALGDACAELIEAYGDETAKEHRKRWENGH